MRNFEAEWERLERAQSWLNVAWGSLFGGMGLTLFAMAIGSPLWLMPLVVVLAAIGVVALVGSVVVALSPIKE